MPHFHYCNFKSDKSKFKMTFDSNTILHQRFYLQQDYCCHSHTENNFGNGPGD